MIRYRIQSVAIVEDGGLQIGYYDPQRDLKSAGLVRLHTLIVPRGFDYDDEIDAVHTAINHLLNDVDEDWKGLRTLADVQAEQAAPVSSWEDNDPEA